MSARAKFNGACACVAALVLFGASPSSGQVDAKPEGVPSSVPGKGAGELSDSVLREAVAAGEVPDEATSSSPGSMVVEVLFRDGEGIEARSAIRDAEGDPSGAVAGELIQAEVPLDELEALEADPAVQFVRVPLDYAGPGDREEEVRLEFLPTDVGTYTGAQVAKTNADSWHAAGITGAGVKIGIIDSFATAEYNAARSAGEIPAVSGTICRNNGVNCSLFSGVRHGIGVAETVADMAPGAQLYFGTAVTAADTDDVLDYFDSQGVQIVTRSQTGRYDGPGDGTGPIADVIAEGVSDGMFYLNSAGNSAGRNGANGSYWRGTWSDLDGDGIMNFGGSVSNEYLGFSCESTYVNGLRWSDFGEGSSTTDYDITIFDYELNVIGSSTGTQGIAGGSAPPIENDTTISCPTGGFTPDVAYMRIQLYCTVAPGCYSSQQTTGDVLEFMTNGASVELFQNPSSSTGPMADLNSAGAVSVGAVDPAAGITIANYSSEGPTNATPGRPARVKPDLSAPSCVATTAYAPGCFNGTSGATPVVAGAAALALDGNYATSPSTLKSFLLPSVTDRGAAGADNIYGTGELTLTDLTPAPPADPPAEDPTLDRTPPTVRALGSRGKAGKFVNLRYTSFDDSLQSQETVTVLRRGRLVATIESQAGISEGGTYGVGWKAPKRGGTGYVYCVISRDAAGNASPESCASIKLKKKKRRRR